MANILKTCCGCLFGNANDDIPVQQIEKKKSIIKNQTINLNSSDLANNLEQQLNPKLSIATKDRIERVASVQLQHKEDELVEEKQGDKINTNPKGTINLEDAEGYKKHLENGTHPSKDRITSDDFKSEDGY